MLIRGNTVPLCHTHPDDPGEVASERGGGGRGDLKGGGRGRGVS